METFIVNGKEVRMATNWDEVTIKQYLEILKLEEERNDSEFQIPELHTMRLVEILCNAEENEINELTISDLTRAMECMNNFITTKPEFKVVDHININGVDYSFNRLTDPNKLTTGEYISIKVTQENYRKQELQRIEEMVSNRKLREISKIDSSKSDSEIKFRIEDIEIKYDNILKEQRKEVEEKYLLKVSHKIMAILVRPAERKIDPETGKVEWVVEKFDDKNLEYRAELFRNNLPITTVFGGYDFFSNGNNS